MDILAQLGVYKTSPKFFIIYAHDNKNFPGYEAHSELVKKFIVWFKKLRLDVVSDRSPHGLVAGRGVEIEGANVDIIKNQVCLLPQQLQRRSASYVLIFGSKLLERYMEDEETQLLVDETSYNMALIDACRACAKDHPRTPSDSIDTGIIEHVVQELYRIQLKYSKMNHFHHVLTEMALVDFRAEFGSSSYTLPIRLGELRDDDMSFPKSIRSNKTRLRVTVDPVSPYTSLFKILLEFEDFEDDRTLLEALRDAFVDQVKIISDGDRGSPNQIRNKCEASTTGALRSWNDSEKYRVRERQITTPSIRQILNKRSLLGLSSIRRLSGEELLGDLIDIELFTAKRSPESDRKKDEQQPITIHGLFEKRELAGSQEISPKRIHIQGPPGVGKSTLSRRIMYEYNWNPRLCSMFDLVIVLPLWKLKHSNNLEQLLFDEYFQLEPQGRQLAAALCELFLKSKSLPEDDAKHSLAQGNNVLFILDGLDETQGLVEKSRDVISMLIKCPNVIITSRLTANNSVNRVAPVDLEIEARGLSIKSVWKYLQDENFVSAEHAENIYRFVETNELVLEMIRIPIQLDMLCYGWNDLIILESYVAHDRDGTKASEDHENDGDTVKPPTMTKLYQAFIRRLWRNDIVGLKKSDHGELLTYDIVNAVRDPARLMRAVHHETDLLVKLAFMSVCANQLFFTDKDVRCAIRELESRNGNLPLALERNLEALSFIRLEYGVEGLRQYRFIHLTIQEFFAAQYLAQELARWNTYLSAFKYSRRWETIWHFLAGLVSSSRNSSNDIKWFFEILENEPRDLQGSIHAQLTVNCLAECEWQLGRAEHPQQQKLLADLTAWIHFEYDAPPPTRLSHNSRFPEDVLESVIPKSWLNSATFNQTWEALYKILSGRRIMSERLCNYILDFCEPFLTRSSSDLEDIPELNPYGLMCVRGLLEYVSFLPRSTFKRLLKYFHDGHFNEIAIKFADQILKWQSIPEWAQIDMIEILMSLHSSRSERASAKEIIQDTLERLNLAPASCRHLMKIFVQARECGTSPAWVVSLLKSQTRLPPKVVSGLSEYLPESPQSSQSLGWCDEDINKILASQMELDSRTIEKLRHRLKTPNSHERLDLAINLASFPELHNEILPLLLEAFESAYDDSLHKGLDKLHDIDKHLEITMLLLGFRQVRTQIFTKLLSHVDYAVRLFAIRKLQEHTDLDDVGRPLFWNLLRERPRQTDWISNFLRKNIHLICEDPVTELLSLLHSVFEESQRGYESSEVVFDLILMFEEEVDKRSPAVEDIILEAMRFDKVASRSLHSVTSRKLRLRPQIMERLFQLCAEGSSSASQVLENWAEAIPKALELLQSTTNEMFTLRILHIIASIYVPQPIRSKVIGNISARPIDEIREFCNNLCAENNVTLHRIRAWRRDYGRHWWMWLSLTEFCQNINSFDATEIHDIFPYLFTNESPSTSREDANYCVWIKDDSVYKESANGISSYPLENPALFRSAFRRAQCHNEVPKWQWIGVRPEDEVPEILLRNNK